MTTFIFTGDMLVMLFMILVVIWVSVYASAETLDHSARIPLMDEKVTQAVSDTEISPAVTLKQETESTANNAAGGGK